MKMIELASRQLDHFRISRKQGEVYPNFSEAKPKTFSFPVLQPSGTTKWRAHSRNSRAERLLTNSRLHVYKDKLRIVKSELMLC